MPQSPRPRCHAAIPALVLALGLWGCSRPASPPAAKPPTPAAPAHADDDDHDHDHADHDDHGHADHDDHGHADHGHADHDHPDTVSEGVAGLRSIAARVKDRLAADDRDAADEAVHGLGHQLEDLQGLVRTSSLAADAKAAATKALDDLFECFDQLDMALHAKPGESSSPAEVHASIAARVEQAIEALERIVKPAAAAIEDEAAAIIRAAQTREEDR